MTRGRVLLLLWVPSLILAAAEVGGRIAAGRAGPFASETTRRGDHVVRGFRELLDRTTTSAACVLGRGARDLDACVPAGTLGSRLEGFAQGDGRTYVAWTGTPVEPADLPPGDGTRYGVRSVGMRTSLVVRTAPRADGLFAVACYTLEAEAGAASFGALLPSTSDWRSGDRLMVTAPAGPRPDAPSEVASPLELRAPDGTPLAWALLAPPPAAPELAATWRRSGLAAAAVALVLLAGALIPWRSLCGSGAGLLAALGALLASRLLLLAAAPERLLPRSVGSPSLYGSAEGWGLLASPGALLITSATALLAAAALRRHVLAGLARRRLAMATLAAAAGATIALWELTVLLARDAKLPLLDLGAAARSAGRSVIVLGLLVAIAATAVLWKAALAALRRSAPLETTRWGRADAAAIALLSAMAAIALYRTHDRIAAERLRSEFAPQVLGQTTQREIALKSAVREAAQSALAAAALDGGPGSDRDVAYDLWISGDLFHLGYSSSLDLYDAEGRLRSHFAFGLPRVVDPGARSEGWSLRLETFPLGAAEQSLVHAEIPVLVGERRVGSVVGHVLEEPDNLPFLPGLAPYLAALGPGGPRAADAESAIPDYVRYSPTGAIVVNTLHQPPADDDALRAAAREGRLLVVESGGDGYLAFPIADGGSLHLLMLPDSTLLDVTGAFVRLFVLSLLLVGAAVLAARTARAGGPAALFAGLGGSFYGKLLASVLLASVLPLVGLSLFLRGYIERRADTALADSATANVGFVKRLVEDYSAVLEEDRVPNDEVLTWLRRLVGQDIHLFEDGVLAASSKPELFDSGLLVPRLPGAVQDAVVRGRLPYLVRRERLGRGTIPVAYARIEAAGRAREAVVAVPLVLQQRESRRSVSRIEEMILLATVALAALLAWVASRLARSVAEPVRDLVDATSRIAGGDYATRLVPRTHDEVATLVRGFNLMAEALKAQREDLERRRDYMEALLRHATTGVVSTDAAGRIVTFNPAAEALLAEAARPLRVGASLVETVASRVDLAPLAEALSHPATPGETREIDLPSRAGGRRLQIVRAALPDPAGGSAGTLLLLDDVTDLMRSNQLAAWAEMARAIAHEIKNPLTPIQLSTEHLSRLLADRGLLHEPQVRACLDSILKQVRALREISGEFSAYAKLPTLTLEPTDPSAFLADAVSAYRVAPPAGIEIVEIHEPAPTVRIDRRVLARAIVNLMENAFQAMPDGGVVTVRSQPTSDGREVALSVSDTGRGLDPQARARLFEPYFSTKSSGTGLGLAIARRAAEAHGGRIEVDSAPGPGTTFRILLPAIEGA